MSINSRVDLHLHRARLDRRDHHIGGQRRVGCNHLVAGGLLLRLQRLGGPAVQPEYIGHVGNADLRGVQIVKIGVVARHGRECTRGVLLAAGGQAARDTRIVDPTMGQDILPCHRQGRLRGLEIVIVGERLLDQLIECLGMKQGPPVGGNAVSHCKALGFAPGEIRAADGGRQRGSGVVVDIRSSGLHEVRANRTSGTQQAQRHRAKRHTRQR